MEAVKQIATSVALASVVIGSVYIICPSGTMSRQMKYVIGLIMLLAVITPFVGIKADFGSINGEAQTYAGSDEMLCSQAEYLVESLLSANKISYDRIEVSMDISAGTNISINSVTVYSVENAEEIKELIASNLSVTEVIVKNE